MCVTLERALIRKLLTGRSTVRLPLVLALPCPNGSTQTILPRWKGTACPRPKVYHLSVTRLYVEDPLERGPFGAKSMAEHPGISPIPAIINAIANATGARVKDIPATPDRVLQALTKIAAE